MKERKVIMKGPCDTSFDIHSIHPKHTNSISPMSKSSHAIAGWECPIAQQQFVNRNLGP